MTSLFTRILAGELPARFVWQDEDVAAFLTIAPLGPGHTLVVPRQEVDHWARVDPALFQRCTEVAQRVGRAIEEIWQPPRVGLVIAGFEVEHLHLHVFPAWTEADFDFSRADANPDPADLDSAAVKLRAAMGTDTVG
jgi:diadenosine tetraphosphate (Ap4A) HIT family hydrolase